MLLKVFFRIKKLFFISLFDIAKISLCLGIIISSLFFEMEKHAFSSEAKIDKIDGMIDWERASNYAEAQQNIQIFKKIKADKKRRKELRDAGVPENEIRKIMKNEELAKQNGGNLYKNSKIKSNNKKDKIDDDDVEDNEEDEETFNSENAKQNKEVRNDKKEVANANDDSVVLKDDGDGFFINGGKFAKKKVITNNENNNNYSGKYTNNKRKQNKKQLLKIDTQNEELQINPSQNFYQKKYIDENIYKNYQTKQSNNDISSVPQMTMNNKDEDFEKNMRIALNYNNNYDDDYSNNIDDFKLSMMLKKVKNNADNRENFMIFAKELSKIVNSNNRATKKNNDKYMTAELEKRLNEKLEKKEYGLEEYEYNDDEDMYGYNENSKKSNHKYANISKRFVRNNKNKNNKKNIVDRLGNMYASASKNDDLKKSLNKLDKVATQNNIKKQKNKIIYANNDNDDEDDDEIEISKNTMTEKQIMAKSLGSPRPYKREQKNNNTQYMPPNISQVAYDKNNRHLKPAVFEEHIINQVINNLGDKNAIQTAKALINKVGKADITDEDGNSLLMHSIARKDQSLTAMLLSEGASPNLKNKEGFNPTHLASSNGDDTAMYSLMMSGADPNMPDINGFTPLMYCASVCSANTIRLMLSLGGDVMDVNSVSGKSVLEYAETNNDIGVLDAMGVQQKKLLKKRNPVNLTK